MKLSHSEREERTAARIAEYQDGTISEAVLHASLFALGMRGHDLAMTMREQTRVKFESRAERTELPSPHGSHRA